MNNQSVVVGCGSNVIAMPVVEKLVIRMGIKGIHRVKENKDFVWMKVAAGENWDSLVRILVKKNIFGLENLALIPGLVGAAPIQNIGAYGREVSEFVEEIQVFDKSGEERTQKAPACGFGYRTSIFKSNNDLIVGSVTFKLLKRPEPKIEYPDLKNLLNSLNLRVLFKLLIVNLMSAALPEIVPFTPSLEIIIVPLIFLSLIHI